MKETLKYLKSPWAWLIIAGLVIALLVWRPWDTGTGDDTNAEMPGPDDVIPTSSDYDVKPLINLIYSKISGMNIFYYPEIINIIADLNDELVVEAFNYWQQKYSGSMDGQSLTQALQSEAHGGMYDPAIGRLTGLGLV